MSRSSAKRWCFTLNNPDSDFDVDVVANRPPEVEYLVFQHEIAPATGTEHIQGYVMFNKRKTLNSVRSWMDTAHWEVAKGTPAQNKAYCTKEDSRLVETVPVEFGEIPANEQGARSDLLTIKAKIDEGVAELDIAEEHFTTWARSFRALREYKRMKISPREWKTEVWVVVGPTGTGKSHFASQMAPPEELYYKQNSQWWDGLENQEVVILDDFYGWIRYDEMLRLMDRYPLLLQTKGGQVSFRARKLVITSNLCPQDWYGKIAGSKTGLSAFYRRVEHWMFLGNQISIVANSWSEFQEKIDLHFLLLQ